MEIAGFQVSTEGGCVGDTQGQRRGRASCRGNFETQATLPFIRQDPGPVSIPTWLCLLVGLTYSRTAFQVSPRTAPGQRRLMGANLPRLIVSRISGHCEL